MAGVLEDCAFGDFKRYPFRGAAVALEQRHKAVGQLGVHQVVCREVDRNVHRQAVSAPLRALCDGMDKHPLRDRPDITGLFSEGDEIVRRHEPAGGMLPAHERLCVKRADAIE